MRHVFVARRVAVALLLWWANALAAPAAARAQQPAHPDTARQQPDTLRQRSDTLVRPVTTLKEVTVTATPMRRQSPASSTTVSAGEIERAPATNPWDLLRQTAGVEVHEQGQGPGFAPTASLRGFSSDHSTDLALWVDGVPVNEPVNGHAEGYNDWSLLFPEAIHDVEVIDGPVNPRFGNFALAGVVNVRTLERMQGSRAELSGGAYGRLEGSFLTGVDQPTTGAVLGVRGLREGGWRPHSGYDLGQLHARAVHQLSDRATIDAGIGLYGAGWDSPGYLTTAQFAARDYDVVVDPTDGGFKRRAQERVSLRYIAGPSLLWRSTVYATQGRWQLFLNIPPEPGEGEGSGSQSEEEDTRYGFGATSALTWSGSRAEVTVGTEGRWDHADYENWLTQARVRQEPRTLVGARQASGALFLASSADLTHHFRLNLGSRVDVLGTRSSPTPVPDAAPGGADETQPPAADTRAVVSPKLGALYHIPRLGAVYVNVSRGFRAADGVITDPSMPFITSWAYEAGVKLDLHRVTASAALFRADVSNEQTFDPITLTTTSGGASRRQGVELTADAHLTPALRAHGDWTFTDATYRDFITEDGDDLSGTPVFNTAKYVGSAAVELSPPGAAWLAQVSTNAVGPYTPFDQPGVTLPAYALLHVGGEYRVGDAVLQLGVRNVMDHAYAEIRAGEFIAPGQPRSVYGGVRYRF
ncbi:MAG TPA: TonB-dependent receptor [Gemmatimonadales bacterium]|nr:TonB-dependent receptor [Gemmatimonadales bacterium]